MPEQKPHLPGDMVTYRELELRLNETRQQCIEALRLELKSMREELVAEAFPAGDAKGHKDYHTATMDAIADRKALVKDMRNNVAKAVLWLILVLLGNAVWEYFKREAQK